MFKRIKENRAAAGDGGFTLIELLVVIIILGILAAVVVFAVGGVGDKGQSAACKIDTRTIRTAEEAALANANSSGLYLSEADLQSGGFLSEQSTYHDVALGAGSTSFVIKVVGTPATPGSAAKCGGVHGDTVVAGTAIF